MNNAVVADTVYKRIEQAWLEAGLDWRRLVMETPGWQAAQVQVNLYCAERGVPGFTMGPLKRDSWFGWLHNLSHALERGGHCLPHAECELQLTALAIGALRARE